MSLQEELGLIRPFASLAHETLLNIYYTSSCIKRLADEFFRQFGLTDVQFNLLMLLKYQSGKDKGISQARLSKMMLVNRANITSLVDRMEKAALVERTADPTDRRNKIVVMTSKARDILEMVEPVYARKIDRILADFRDEEKQQLKSMLERVRAAVIE